MTFFSITDLSFYIKDLLNHETGGIVHSVYRKTINLSIGGTLAALQAKNSPLSPISLITELTSEEMEALNIKRGDSVTIKNNSIIIHKADSSTSDIIFSFEEAALYNLNLADSLPDSSIHILYDNIKKSLADISTGGFEVIFNHRVNEDTSMMLIAAKKRIELCTRLYKEKNYTESATELARLIGLGIGLTPSGDDFLCGLLAGLILTGQTDSALALNLKSAIAGHLTDTVEVSAAFLHCALNGQFSLAVNHLATCQDVQAITDEFLAIGHSSGTDTLCGILYVLELLIFN